MTSRERAANAFDFKPCDKVPAAVFNSPAGFNELGQPLIDLFKSYENDFNDFSSLEKPIINKEYLKEDGSYLRVEKDIWGATWKYLIYGMHGIVVDSPLNDWNNLKDYKFPTPPIVTNESIENAKKHMETKYLKTGWISIFEVLHAVRNMEDVLIDIMLDEPEINMLADKICDYQLGVIDFLLKSGCNAIEFGDDYGSQEALMLSPTIWRKFFKPRYERLMKPIKDAGKKIAFHSCGMVDSILEDFADLGVNSIWPQLNLYDLKELNKKSKDLKLAITIHPERSHLMTFGTPEMIKNEIYRLNDIFEPLNGGSWFHVEIDHGFSYENSKALFDAIWSLR